MAKDSDQTRNLLPILGAAALGALVGAVVALLVAPKSGAELREDLKARAGDAKAKTEEFLKTTVAQTAQGIKQKVQEHLHQAEEDASAEAEEA